MPRSTQSVSALREVLAARFPEKARRPEGLLPTGIAPVDEALGGGLPAGRLTELVSAAPSSGGQLVFFQLLLATRAARQRLALVDGADGFDPQDAPPDALPHLVWARCAGIAPALAATEILVRDGNYAAVVLDVRGLPARSLRQLPPASWYRLQRAAEGGAAAVLVQSTFPLVPGVPWRLVLPDSVPLGRARSPRAWLAAHLRVEKARGHEEADTGGLARAG
ncbi:MAG TPA: hypothetical protein VHV47_02880 [Opitutaceae bacterium]|jgi:hypothetical protein|nr:hypothetical protein [Opitutaceae bacterium]